MSASPIPTAKPCSKISRSTFSPAKRWDWSDRRAPASRRSCSLLRRQYEPQDGRILIDGRDIAHVTWDSLNEAIAEVPQVPGVFHRAVRDNIRYARPDARDEDVDPRGRRRLCA